MLRSHFYLQNHFGVGLKSRGLMLELSQGKHSQILMDNERTMLYTITQRLTILEIRTCISYHIVKCYGT